MSKVPKTYTTKPKDGGKGKTFHDLELFLLEGKTAAGKATKRWQLIGMVKNDKGEMVRKPTFISAEVAKTFGGEKAATKKKMATPKARKSCKAKAKEYEEKCDAKKPAKKSPKKKATKKVATPASEDSDDEESEVQEESEQQDSDQVSDNDESSEPTPKKKTPSPKKPKARKAKASPKKKTSKK